MILKIYFLLIMLQIFLSKKTIDINDKNDLKKELQSHANILIFFYDNERSSPNIFKLVNEISDSANKIAKVLTIDCKKNKKLCKQYKVDTTTFVIQHFHKGKFNKVYDRKLRLENLMRFLEDPTGELPWEEEDNAKDIIHATSAQDLQKLVESYKTKIPPLMLMFYAPWCGYCKKMKPEFAAAATSLKERTIFVGINGVIASTEDLKHAFNITGYPSIFLVLDGSKIYKFENENSKEALIKFAENPIQYTKPKDIPWSEETNEIDFLTDDNFNAFISQYESILVMFYAPWCGHCKAIKPEILAAVKQLKKTENPGRIAALDSTEQTKISTLFNISGFPTLKYFRNGQFQYDITVRTAEGIVKFMEDPVKPQEPEKEIHWNEEVSSVVHPHVDDFKTTLKSHKHSLVMFYAPWCGHCKKAKPGFTAAANELKDNHKVVFVAIDCTNVDNRALCKSEGVDGFPTLRYYNYGKITSHSEYSLEREHDDFIAFMKDPINPKLDARRHWKHILGNEAVQVLETDNFKENVISKSSGALIMFYAPWCGHCNAMKPAFVSAAQYLKTSLPSFILGSVDATSETKLGAQYSINGFPTLIYFSPNGDWVRYTGERNEKDMVEFIHKKDEELKYAESEKKRLEIEELENHRQEIERKEKEENEKKRKENESKRLEAEKKEQEKNEKKRLNDKKKKDEDERKRLEAVRKEQEKNERKYQEIEEKKRLEAVRKEQEENERKRQEIEEKKRLEAVRKEQEENERKGQEIEEKKRLEAVRMEKEEIQRKHQEIEEKKRLEDVRMEQEENERKYREIEENQRLEAERKEQEEIELKRQEMENKRIEKVSIDDKIQQIKESENIQGTEADSKVISQADIPETISSNDIMPLMKINDVIDFENKMKSVYKSLIYFHKSDKKNHIKKKVLKFIEKYSVNHKILSFDIDCSALFDICDKLGVVDFPSLFAYVNGKQSGSISATWGEEDIEQLINNSLRDEL